KRRGCLTVPRLTLMSLIKMMLVMVSVAAISKTFGLLRFLLRLSFLARSEERFSRNAETDLVCRLLLEKKTTYRPPTPLPVATTRPRSPAPSASLFFLPDPAPTDRSTLSLHDALPILKRRGCLTVPRLTLMSLIKMMLVMVSVAAISKTFGLLRFLLRLSFLA